MFLLVTLTELHPLPIEDALTTRTPKSSCVALPVGLNINKFCGYKYNIISV